MNRVRIDVGIRWNGDCEFYSLAATRALYLLRGGGGGWGRGDGRRHEFRRNDRQNV